MKLNIKNIILCSSIALAAGLSSCVDDLNVTPINPQVQQEFDQQAVFTKIYATLGFTGMRGPDGNGDLSSMGIDEGKSAFYRMMWDFNELPTDEAHCCWGDVGIPEMNYAQWTSSHTFVQGLYYRLFFDITLCNHFLEMTEGMTDAESVKQRAEVRFIRALNYFYLLDLYGNVPLVTEVLDEPPLQSSRAELFNFVETELLAIPNDMSEPRTAAYGRADRAAAWLLLARLYLNAEVYVGQNRYNDASIYADMVMKTSYELCPNYQHLFMADNDVAGGVNRAMQEIILPIRQDGNKTQSYGGSFFLIAATHTSGMPDWGSIDGWGGIRARKALSDKFTGSDDRFIFYTEGRNPIITNTSAFTDGYSVTKWTNLRADGGAVSDEKIPDTDVPFFRLAEAYLTYAEAQMRLGNEPEARNAVNELRIRANAATFPVVTLDIILDEWCREFYFEGRRRMDLIRYNRFGGSTDYNWDWKGGSANGTTFESKYNLLPIPASELNANPNLVQTEGY